ncbi:right-handed parallel beta-helix repeat-containing protein [Klebsiella pneumoniae]
MATTGTQQAAQFSAEAAVSAAEAKQYLIEAQQGYQDTSAAAQEAKDAAAAAATSEQNATYSEANAAQSAAAAVDAKDDAEAAASSASDYAKNKFTFYKTASDPDGTIAGLAATTDGQSFWVAQGPDALSAAWQYQNKAGVAVLQAKQPGTAAITGTIREFPTLAAAQADADAGNIPVNSTTYVRSQDGSALADEYINNGGTLEPTGRKMPSQGYVDRVINTSTDNGNITVTSDSDGNTVDVRDDFGGVNIPGIPAPVQDILQQVKKDASPAILRLTDAENAAFASVDEYGHLRLPGMPESMQERLEALKKRMEVIRKQGMILDVRDCGFNAKTGQDAHRPLQRGYNWLSANGGGYLYAPPAYYKMSIPVVPKSGVSLVGGGQEGTIFLPMGYLPAFQYRGKPTEASPEIYVENIQFCDFTVDGENQQLHPERGYIPDIKGIFLQYYRNAYFDRLTVRNTGATGFGVDMPDKVFVANFIVENCGRLAQVGDLGASGFGLGTSFMSSEPIFLSKIVGRGNKNYGIFFEPQRSVGTAQDAIVSDATFSGNYAGMADCGIEGLIASNINLRGNQYGFMADTGTNNGGRPGHRGKLINLIVKDNTKHGMYFVSAKDENLIGEYAIIGAHIFGNGEDGINFKYANNRTNSGLRVSDCDINSNGRHGLHFESGPVVNAHVTNTRFWNNGKQVSGNGINSSASVKKSRFSMNSYYDLQSAPTQQYPVSISGDMEDVDISFNHGAGNVHNSLNLTGNKTRVTTLSNPGIE